jgi:DNA-binding MarR family transcriptional regulator
VAERGAARDRQSGGLPAARRKLQGVPGEAVGQANPVELNQLVHERVRLGIVSALAVNPTLTFKELKAQLQLSDGNLSVHARKLEEAGYVACTKSCEGRIPRTEYRLTAAGREALEQYIAHMEALIQAVREE